MSNNNDSILGIFHEHYDALHKFLTARLRCKEAAADVVQETYLRMLSLDDAQAIRHPRAFLYRTALNLVTDNHRKQQARGECAADWESLELIPSPEPAPYAVVLAQQRLNLLRSIIAELPPKCRAVFLLHKFNDIPHAEIAARLGISRNMVEKHIINAMLHCRRRMDECEGG